MTKTPRKLVPLAVALLALAAPTSAQKAGKIPADADIPIKLNKLKVVKRFVEPCVENRLTTPSTRHYIRCDIIHRASARWRRG